MNGQAPSDPPPRLAGDEPFPPYSYVTGRFPHPTSDPRGHSYGHSTPPPAALDPRRWSDSRVFLRGCDLFNHGYYWESHELWESLWHACGRSGPTAELLQGLIKLAAAGVKAREGRSAGVQRHARRAAELFSGVREAIGADHYSGLDLSRLAAIARSIEQAPPDKPSDAAVEVVFDFWLVPRDAT